MSNQSPQITVPIAVKIAAYLYFAAGVIGALLRIYFSKNLTAEGLSIYFSCLMTYLIGRGLLKLDRGSWNFVIYFQNILLVAFVILVIYVSLTVWVPSTPYALIGIAVTVLINFLLLLPSSRRAFKK